LEKTEYACFPVTFCVAGARSNLAHDEIKAVSIIQQIVFGGVVVESETL
jgi:hypothetical protein